MSELKAELDANLLLKLASCRAACCLGFERSDIEEILVENGSDQIEQRRYLLFIRMCRALDAIFCGNLDEERQWLHDENTLLNDIPRNLLKSVAGLSAVVEYLEGLLMHGSLISKSV